MKTDKRIFYNFDLKGSDANLTEKLERVSIIRPGGNDTAIVWDNIARADQADISLKIQDAYPGVEQVMFAEEGSDGLKRGQMAGGEFCGNATRSFGYMNLKGNDGEIELEVSGSSKPLKVIVENGMSKTSIPVGKDLNSVLPMDDGSGNYVAHLEGISFVITFPDNALGDKIINKSTEDEQKSIVMDILKRNGFADKYPASGVLIANKQDDGSYKLEPFVYVRDTGTIYYETGCGSGSTAVGLMVAKKDGKPVDNLKITQPSGMDLIVSVDRDEAEFKGASVNGPIYVLFDGHMYISPPHHK